MIRQLRAVPALKSADRLWAASGVGAVALFVLGLVFSDLLASPGEGVSI